MSAPGRGNVTGRNGGREGGDGAGEGHGGMEEDCHKVVHFFETQASFTGLSNKTKMRWIITVRLGALPLPVGYHPPLTRKFIKTHTILPINYKNELGMGALPGCAK
jgi:hypothetical protein